MTPNKHYLMKSMLWEEIDKHILKLLEFSKQLGGYFSKGLPKVSEKQINGTMSCWLIDGYLRGNIDCLFLCYFSCQISFEKGNENDQFNHD